MGGTRIPGPGGHDDFGVCLTDAGTGAHASTRSPSPTGQVENIAAMSLEDRFGRVIQMTGPKLPGEVAEEFIAMITPSTIGIMVVVLAAWAGSHYVGIGFVADILFVIGGLTLVGWQLWSVCDDFVAFLKITYHAQTISDLDAAATHLANFVAVVGVTVFLALVTRGAGKVAGKAGLTGAAAKAARQTGILFKHFEAFLRVAKARNRIILVRSSNPQCLPWIRLRYPAKPVEIKAKTSKRTGLVTAKPYKRKEIDQALRAGYYVVDNGGVPRGMNGAKLDLDPPIEWPIEPFQIIDPKTKKPLTGDYDLMSVIDPDAPGRILVERTSNGRWVKDISNPDINDTRRALNQEMGDARLMHGSHDGFADLDSAGGVVAFEPDGSYRLLNTLESLEEYFKELGRVTVMGSHRVHNGPVAPGSNSIVGPWPGSGM